MSPLRDATGPMDGPISIPKSPKMPEPPPIPINFLGKLDSLPGKGQNKFTYFHKELNMNHLCKCTLLLPTM